MKASSRPPLSSFASATEAAIASRKIAGWRVRLRWKVIDDQLVHPYRVAFASFAGRGKPRVSGIIGRAGWYMGDLGCAVMEGTFQPMPRRRRPLPAHKK